MKNIATFMLVSALMLWTFSPLAIPGAASYFPGYLCG